MNQTEVRRRPVTGIYPILAICACALLPFIPALQNGFVYDDHFQVESNPYIRSFSHLKTIFTEDVWEFSPATESNNYRPLHMFAYLLVYQIAGLSPVVFHLLNLLLNAICALLLWRIALHYLPAGPAVACAMLFSVHPVHAEVVVWIGGTTDLFCTIFLFSSFLLYRKGMLLLSMTAFFLALLSKETALVFPAIIIAESLLFRRDRSVLFRWLSGACVVLTLYLSLRYVALETFLQANKTQLSFADQLLAAVSFAGLYIFKAVAPFRLNAFYDIPLPLDSSRVVISLSSLVLVLLLFWKLYGRKQFIFGVLWFALMLAPALVVIGVSPVLFAERYLYIPTAGLSLALMSLWPFDRPFAWPAFLLLCLLLAGFTFQRSFIWRNDLTLWQDTITKSPNSLTVNYNLATAYMKSGNCKASLHYYKTVLEFDPKSAESFFNMSYCQYKEGDLEGASNSLHMFLFNWTGGLDKRNVALKRLEEIEAAKRATAPFQ